jgi:hypothetical protein
MILSSNLILLSRSSTFAVIYSTDFDAVSLPQEPWGRRKYSRKTLVVWGEDWRLLESSLSDNDEYIISDRLFTSAVGDAELPPLKCGAVIILIGPVIPKHNEFLQRFTQRLNLLVSFITCLAFYCIHDV